MEGWFDEEGSNQLSCASASPRPGLFALQRECFCRMETGCAPGLQGLDCSEVESQLMSSASRPTQPRQFYQISTQMGTSMFAEEPLHQQSPLEEFFYPDKSYPTSSSSSLRSLSVGSSPEYCSSPILRKPNCAPHMPDTNLREPSIDQVAHPRRSSSLIPPPQQASTMQAFGHIRGAQFPTPTGDDEAMARAMIAVISSSISVRPPKQREARRRGGAFEPYDPSLVPRRAGGEQVAQGQEMIKRGFSMLRRIREMSAKAQAAEARPTSNQLHHMISERKRREKLNESFAALRTLLPPGTKRDKASVLANTIDCVNSLRTQISTLKEKNRVMEARLLLPGETDHHEAEGDASGGDVTRAMRSVQITRSPESSSRQQQIELRVFAWVECDMIELVLHVLDCMREMRGVELVSLDASIIGSPQMVNPVGRAILITIQIKGDDDWDEGSFKEAITGAVDEALAALS